MNAPAWLAELVAHAYENAPAPRAILDSVGARSVADFQRIPITRKDALIDLQQLSPPFGGFLGISEQQLGHIFVSPGPLFDPQGTQPDYWRFAQALRAAGFSAGDMVLNASAYHLTPMGAMFDDAARGLGCIVVPAGTGNTELQIVAARRLGVVGYCGTPSFLYTLLEQARGLYLRHAVVCGEMLPASLRASIEAYGVRVFQAYGTADLGCLGFECEQHSGLHVADGALVEIVDPLTGASMPEGEQGEVVATVNSPTYPLLRFGTGDLSVLDESACTCGRTSPRLLGIRGRVGDAVKVRGMFVHPRQLEEVVRRFPAVQRYTAVVDRSAQRDSFTLLLEAPAVPDTLGAALRDVLHVRAALELVPVGSIAEQDAARVVDRRDWGRVS